MRPNEELLLKIGIVRSRWKAFVWVRGLAWVLGVTVAALLIALWAANSVGISTATVTVLRMGLLAAVIFTIVKTLVLPLRRIPDDTQLARFVEEKNPGLEDRLVSAVEAVLKPKPEQGIFTYLLTKDALDRTKHLRFRDQINKRKFGAFAALSGALAIALLISLYISSLFFPIGSAMIFGSLVKPPDIAAFELKVTP